LAEVFHPGADCVKGFFDQFFILSRVRKTIFARTPGIERSFHPVEELRDSSPLRGCAILRIRLSLHSRADILRPLMSKFACFRPFTFFLVAGLFGSGFCSVGAELLPPGHRPLPPGVHALTGARVVVKPGEAIDDAVIVIRDGVIEAVGNGEAVPPDARIWEMKGTTIYAGFIDAHLLLGTTNPPVETSHVMPIEQESFTSAGIRFFGVPGQERDPGNRGPGSELAVITPERRAATSYSPAPKTLQNFRDAGFTAGNVVPEKGVLRGTSAFALLADVNPNEAILKPDLFQCVAFDPAAAPENAYPRSLMGVISVVRQTFFDAQHYAIAGPGTRIPPGRTRAGFNPALGALQPAVSGEMPVLFEPGSALMVDRAGHVGRELNLKFHIVASGQEWRRPDLAKAAGASMIVPVNFPEIPGLPEDEDWEAVSLDQLRAWDWAAENPAVLRQNGIEIALTTYGLSEPKQFRTKLQAALDRGLSEEDALAALTTIPAKLCGLADQLGTIERGKLANLTIVEGTYFNPDAKVREVWIEGRRFPSASASSRAEELDKISAKKDSADDKKSTQRELRKKRQAQPPSRGRGPLSEPRAVLIEGATLWTSGPEGVIENGHLFVVDGKIRAVGRDKPEVPDDLRTVVIDAQGKHVTPGLVDAHSHSMILGGVNEGTLPSSAMVRIGDVINSETENIYRQLAGGLTVANLLHGSANPMGGQNAVIKLRDGASPGELIMAEAPPGIKFALGENVKQSNWGDRNVTRFPQTRMGVPTFMENRFTAARHYLQAFARARETGSTLPRRDLELETLGEILEGKRWIHCHSYRQDEIVAFLRLMEAFGIQVATLQHVLEGYKVADEIARHGAGASAFSDWWAFKYEVLDAVPYAGSLMHERGVLVSFNSDSSDLARRMNLEAAKAVKYGGTPEAEAFKFVTINPARQLRIDQHVGSLEPGKHADFVIWSRSPLDTSTLCLETWIDGKKYFDRALDAGRVAALEQERSALLQKARKLAGKSGVSGKEAGAAREAFFKRALERMTHWKVDQCMDCEVH
jgi:imidazolonepropionase-like amidohydrolase